MESEETALSSTRAVFLHPTGIRYQLLALEMHVTIQLDSPIVTALILPMTRIVEDVQLKIWTV